MIGQIWRKSGGRRSGVVLVGQSIGGGIALMIAALDHDYPLLGVSVSGIGDVRPVGGGPSPLQRDARIAAAEEIDAMVDSAMPGLLAGHPIRAEDADEEAPTIMEMNLITYCSECGFAAFL